MAGSRRKSAVAPEDTTGDLTLTAGPVGKPTMPTDAPVAGPGIEAGFVHLTPIAVEKVPAVTSPRFGVHIARVLVITLTAVACSGDIGASGERQGPAVFSEADEISTPVPQTPDSHSETASGLFRGEPGPGRTIVVMTESGCSLHAIDGPIPAGHLGFVARNTTDDAVAFDIGMLARGHTFEELAADIAAARDLEHRGGPYSQRPRYLHGSITGDTTFGHAGAPGPSLLLLSVGASIAWAVICYRSSEGTGLEPIGVLGPLEVGTR